MKRLISFVLLYLQLCVSCNPQAFAAGPFIWGADNRAQGLQSSGALFSNGQPIDYNGPINKIGNNEAVVDTTGWSTYADAAAVTPVDCTGGSPSITWTRNTSSPLRGTADFLNTKGATNRQGDGVAYAFTLDAADAIVGKPINTYFNFTASANYANDDIRIYVYDVTNATLITPQAVTVLDQSYTFQTTFAATASTSYRLCVHTSSTNATAYTAQFDNFFVGPTNLQSPSELPTAMSDATATALGYKAYSSGTNYNGGISPTITGPAGFAVVSSQFIPYQLQDGTWRIRFNFRMTFTSATNFDSSVNGVTFGASTFPCAVYTAAAVVSTGTTGASSGNLTLRTGTTTGAASIWCEGALASKPTWAY